MLYKGNAPQPHWWRGAFPMLYKKKLFDRVTSLCYNGGRMNFDNQECL